MRSSLFATGLSFQLYKYRTIILRYRKFRTSLPERRVFPQSATTIITDKDFSVDTLSLETPRKDLTQNPVVEHIQVSPSKSKHSASYLHLHMFEPVPGCGKELVEAVRDAVSDIHYEQTGPVHPDAESSKKTTSVEKPERQGILRMPSTPPLVFSEFDLPSPPNMGYAKDISRLFREWEDRTCAQVVAKGVHVPYRYWGRLYRDIAPKSWKVLKQEFSEAKVRFLRTLSTFSFSSS